MAILLPVLFTYAMVGIVFDYDNYERTSYYLYGDLRDKTTVEVNEKYSSEYKIIETPRDVRDLYDIDARLSLHMKVFSYSSGSFISGLLKNSIAEKSNDIEIQIYIQYQKSIIGIPEDAEPIYDLESKIKKAHGTHFIKNTRNGAVIQSTLIFYCKSKDHRERVLKVMRSHLEKSGTFDSTFIEKIKKIEEELGSDYPGFYFRQQYCAGCRHFLKSSLDGMLQTAENLTEIFKNDNGVPIKMELEDFSTVFKNFSPFEENKEIIKKLDEVDELYNDIEIARNTFLSWDYDRSIELNPEEEKLVEQFDKDLKSARKAFRAAILNLDIRPSASIHQFDKAYEAYGSIDTHDRFQKRLEQLQKDLDRKEEEL